ncbi:exonuclease SbcC, partial [Escherichia coli]|nr:exonuclease SbcC [Escherichia coli]
DYSAITSGGLRTILSIGYYLSLMNLSLKMNINFPNFIMIDTVGKYLGKTGTNEIVQSIENDIDEGLTDPEKYKNIYGEILKITELAKSKNISCQIIIVDNDIPDDIKKCEDDFVVEHFSTIGVLKSKIGLIDDL